LKRTELDSKYSPHQARLDPTATKSQNSEIRVGSRFCPSGRLAFIHSAAIPVIHLSNPPQSSIALVTSSSCSLCFCVWCSLSIFFCLVVHTRVRSSPWSTL